MNRGAFLDQLRWWLDRPTFEAPNGSNRVEGLTDQPRYYAAAWCGMYVSRCRTDAGFELLCFYVPTEMEWAQAGEHGLRWIDDPTLGRPGMAITFSWLDGPPSPDHIGVVEVAHDGNGDPIPAWDVTTPAMRYITLEGNVGNRVQRLVRTQLANVVGFVDMPFDDLAPEPPTPTPVPQPPEDEMTLAFVKLPNPDRRVWLAGIGVAPIPVASFPDARHWASILGVKIAAADEVAFDEIELPAGSGAKERVTVLRDGSLFGIR